MDGPLFPAWLIAIYIMAFCLAATIGFAVFLGLHEFLHWIAPI